MSYGESWANASNTPFRFYKKWLEQGGIATPIIIRWPAKIARNRDGSILNQIGHVTDFMPTLCELAGARYPITYKGNTILPMVGESLAPVIEKGETESHAPIYWSLNGHKSVVFDHYQLVSSGAKDPWHLYDLRGDRSELKDIAGNNGALVKKYVGLWEKWARNVGVDKVPGRGSEE
jgi:arylsulfatase